MIDVFNANKTNRVLVISDLHIGKTCWLQNTDIAIDWYHIVKEIEKELSDIVISNKVTSIVLLGDIKNNIYKVGKEDWNLIPNFLHSLSEICEVYLIPGNHDSRIGLITPEKVHLLELKGWYWVIFSQHTDIRFRQEVGSNINKIVMGHIHPTFFRENSVLNGQKNLDFLKSEKRKLYFQAKRFIGSYIVTLF